ncbi:MAG: hypothetical protein PHW95_05130 [Patescibacteria group bacterium]|nr:hypothetical protein [Patescibacteria group bacterium]
MNYLTKKNIKRSAIILFIIGYFYLASIEYGGENGHPYSNRFWDEKFVNFYILMILIVLPIYLSFILTRKLVEIRKYLLLLAPFLNLVIAMAFIMLYMFITPLGGWAGLVFGPTLIIDSLANLAIIFYFLIRVLREKKSEKIKSAL